MCVKNIFFRVEKNVCKKIFFRVEKICVEKKSKIRVEKNYCKKEEFFHVEKRCVKILNQKSSDLPQEF